MRKVTRVFKQTKFISTPPFSPKSKYSNTLTKTRTSTCHHQILDHPFQILHVALVVKLFTFNITSLDMGKV